MAKKDSSRRALRFLIDLFKISPFLGSVMIFTQVAFAVFSATIAPIFISKLLSSIASGTATMTESIWLLVFYAASLFIGNVVMVRITIALAFIVETKMQSTVALRVFNHLTSKSLGFHADKMSGSLISDSTRLNGAIERFWDTLIFSVIPVLATILSVCIALGFIIWQYAVVLGVLSIIIVVIIVKSQLSIAPVSRNVAEKSGAMTGHFADVVTNISAVKAFATEDIESETFKKLVSDWKQASIKEMGSVLKISGIFSMMMTIMNIAAFVAAIFATEYKIANIGSIYLVINYTINVVSEIWSVSNATRNYIRTIGDAGPMVATLDEEIDLKDAESPIDFVVRRGEIKFDKINFTHKDNQESLFDGFSLKIKPGEKVGLVGTSGSGKTSLARLLLRFSDLDKGKITIDKKNIALATQKSLHQSIAYVPQEPLLFHRSVRENIAYGNPTASDEEIRHAAKQANALDFIDLLPKGMDTIVGERGVKLSGGQRQRVVIARAILKNAPILVLDEATSALDSENELLIQDALWELMKNRTSIVIAHRLSTISRLDRIIVMQDGRITEEGSHKDLLAINGTYAKLWQHQSGGFIKV
jgi:ATP-binding cassette, subfamily B, bacterial